MVDLSPKERLPTRNKKNTRGKHERITPTNKTSSQLTKHKKKFGAIFGEDFRIRTKNNKIKLVKRRGGSEIMINLAHDTKMM